jgi:phosphate-selective porin OprO/OprP
MGRGPQVLVVSVAAVAVLGCCTKSSRADDAAPPTDREKQLEKRVDDLEKQLAEVNRRLAERGSDKSGDELSERVAELEKLSKKDKDGLFGYWKNGIRMDSADGAFKMRIGGRIQNDWAWFQDNGGVEDRTEKQVEAGTEFRRARLQVGGSIYNNVEFMAEYDFAGGTAKEREVWIGLRPCGGGILQVGSMKEPFGLEEQTSDLFITFLERSAGSEAFAPSFNTGAMWSDTAADDRMTYAVGVFRDANDAGDDTGNARSGEYNETARVTGRPWIGGSADEWIHLGLGVSRRTPSSEMAQFRAHPEMHLAPVVADTGAIDAGRVMEYEGEAAFSMGQLWGSAEYYLTNVDAAHGSDPSFHAWAVQAGWFLTGESRPYNAKKGVFDRIVPKSNFACDGKADGMGAWELAARFDNLDLNDGGVSGGDVKTLSLGVNWYLNPNTKVQLDWVHAAIQDVGTLIALQMRFQVDF